MKKPTLLQLTYLVALADNGHFGRAADACNISQPGLFQGAFGSLPKESTSWRERGAS
jgi:hypothetical protein